MKILVIGHSVVDYIHTENNVMIKPGGIYYSVLGLLKIMSPNDELHLITALEKNYEYLFSETYGKVNFKYINWKETVPKVHLTIHKSDERTECYENIAKNLNINYDQLNTFDGILINMITGYDITLDQLLNIRKKCNGLIYIDVHSLSRGIDSSNTRHFRLIPNFDHWSRNVNIIQANEYEINTLFDSDDKMKIAKRVLDNGCKFLIETRAEKGAAVYLKEQDQIYVKTIDAEKIKIKNKVGCGDIFGGIFLYTYLKNSDVLSSLRLANHAGAQAAALESLIELNLT